MQAEIPAFMQAEIQQPAKLAYPFFEDLTTANFRKMWALVADSRVLACWSVAGQLRFRLNGEEEIRKVDDISSRHRPAEEVLQTAAQAAIRSLLSSCLGSMSPGLRL